MAHKFQNVRSTVILLVIVFMFSRCHTYYKATKINATAADRTIDSLKSQNRYFVLRSGSEAYYMKNMVLSDDHKTLECTLDSLPPVHRLYLAKGRNGKMQYKAEDAPVLIEVHLYLSNNKVVNEGNYTLQLDQIQKIEVLEKDRKRTTNSYVIGAVGGTIGVFAVVAIIIAATKSSCPFVSAYTNNEFVLQGEIYGGAVYPQLARDDYMPLRMQPSVNNTLQVKISNELQERQYTDFADLLVITHGKNSKVLSDEKGNLYEVTAPRPPIAARTGNHEDVMAPLLRKDDNALLSFDDSLAVNANNYLITTFNKPEGVQKGKLVLAIKNSYWLDYLYGEMARGFGSYYGSFIRKQSKAPASTLLQWAKDQQLPLEVSVKTKNGWQKVTDITTIGPLATREIIVPLDLTGVTTSDFEIKLSSGFMFWEMDYAAIDFSDEKDLDVEIVSPFVATDETAKNVLPELAKRDGVYLEQPVPGNAVTLEYKCPAQPPHTERSYILHTRGYYTHVRDFKGPPAIAFLRQFKKPGGFPAYSIQLYKKFRNTTMESLAQQ